MKGIQYLTSFSDHPDYKYKPEDVLYLMSDGTWMLYRGIEQDLQSVVLEGLAYTNLGDPYRELCQLSMISTEEKESIDMELSKDDGARLYLRYVPASPELIFRLEWGNLRSRA